MRPCFCSLLWRADSAHTFTHTAADWGFTQFATVDEILDPRNGFLNHDVVTLRVQIQIQSDERFSYDSRKETGSVGLKNQGATCYMNSLLQYLYCIAYFRKVGAYVHGSAQLSAMRVSVGVCKGRVHAATWHGVPLGCAHVGRGYAFGRWGYAHVCVCVWGG